MAVNTFNNDIVIGNGASILATNASSETVTLATYDSDKNLVIGVGLNNINIYAGSTATGMAPGGCSSPTFGLSNSSYYFRVGPEKVGIGSGSEYGYYLRNSDDTDYLILGSVAASDTNSTYFSIGNESYTLNSVNNLETNKSVLLNNGTGISHSTLGNMVSINSSGHVTIGSTNLYDTGNIHFYIAANGKSIQFVSVDGTGTSASTVKLLSMYYSTSSSEYKIDIPSPAIFSIASKNITPVYSNLTNCLTLNSTYVSAVVGAGIIKIRGLKMIIISARFQVNAISADTQVSLATINKTNYRPARLTELSVVTTVNASHLWCYCSTSGVIYINSDVSLASGTLVYVSGIAYVE